MAQKGTKEKTTVRRIKAKDDAPKKVVSKEKTTVKTKVKSQARKRNNPFRAIGGYFKGAWRELKLVRWPTRATTWKMTLAVLVFTGLFAVLILLADIAFNWAFEQLLK